MPPKKKLVDTTQATGGHINQLLGRLASKNSNIMTAEQAMAGWVYVDFLDPITGLPSICQEYLIGARGFIAGRIVQLKAEYSKGKSSYCLLQYGAAQKKSGAFCYHIETEGAAAPAARVAQFGADPRQLLQAEQDSIEECIASIDELICEIRGGFGGSVNALGRVVQTKYTEPIDPECKHPILIGVDSFSALGNKERAESDILDIGKTPQIAKAAVNMRDLFRSRAQRFRKTKTLLFLTTQETANIQQGPMAKFGGNTKTARAEQAIGAAASYGIDFSSTKWEEGGYRVGDKMTLTTFKNKIAARGRSIALYCSFDHGFDLLKSDAEFLTKNAGSPFINPKFGLVKGNTKAISSDGGWIKCPLVSSKAMRPEDFVPAFYANEDLLMTCREGMKLYGFGFAFEKQYETQAKFNSEGELEHEEVDDNVGTGDEPTEE